MSESLALSELAKRLERRNEQEAEAILEIEEKKLSELSQRLHKRLNSELNTIAEDMHQSVQRIEAALKKGQEKIIEQEKHLHKEVQDQRDDLRIKMIEFSLDIAEKTEEIHGELNKLKQISIAKRLIYPTLIGIAVVAGLAIGSWSLGAYASTQIKTIEEQRSEIYKLDEIKQKLMKFHGITVYDDGITMKNKPKIFQTKNGNWAVLWKTEEN